MYNLIMAGNTAKTKQVIIMRKDLDLSVGKIAAQASHASLSAVLAMNKSKVANKIDIDISQEELEWFTERFTKVVLYVKSEKELLELHEKAKEAGLNVSRPIVDAGFTELDEPTLTCIAIGPNYKEKVDEITGHLRTYSRTTRDEKQRKYLKKQLKKCSSKDEEQNIKKLLDIK